MKFYKIKLREVTEDVFEIQANSLEEAQKKATQYYQSEFFEYSNDATTEVYLFSEMNEDN